MTEHEKELWIQAFIAWTNNHRGLKHKCGVEYANDAVRAYRESKKQLAKEVKWK